jgi:glycosyltransferase involved in cell wall biosynthesis
VPKDRLDKSGSLEIPGNYRHAFTVFTPTFNRRSTLHRVYESLGVQTFRDFEWLIVDDGSTDGTAGLVEKWQSESDFPIRYVYQENQGKPAAFNRGVQEAQGELFLTLDSDDACVPQALERLKYHWDGIPPGEKDKFSAVTVLCKDQDGRLIGDKFPCDVWDSDWIESFFRYKVKGEKWGFHRTDVLKQFPFPTVPNVKFISEGVLWFALSRRFKTRFVNEILRIYHTNDKGGDRLTALTPTALVGRALFHKYVLNELIDWWLPSPANIFRSAINFSRYSFGVGKGPHSQFSELRTSVGRLLVGISLPLAYAISLKDKWSVARVVRNVR